MIFESITKSGTYRAKGSVISLVALVELFRESWPRITRIYTNRTVGKYTAREGSTLPTTGDQREVFLLLLFLRRNIEDKLKWLTRFGNRFS
jgi:hypothetical protein